MSCLRPLVPALLVFLAVFSGPRLSAGEDEGPPVKLEFDKPEHDFGAAAQEQELKAAFTYRNAGTARITGIRSIGDCGCYGITMSKTELDPGETGTLTVNFRTLMFSGRVTKRIRVLAAGLAPPLTLKLKVDVVAGVILDPGRLWFGDVLVGASPSKTVVAKWHREHGAAFRVTGVEVPGYDLAIEQAPYATADWQGTSITVAFKEAPPLGMFSATALVRTDHPDYPRISLPLTANVTGKVWVQSRTVFFGWVTEGTGKRTSLLVRPFDDTVNLGTVSARSREGRVIVSVEKHPRGNPGWWRLVVEVPETAEIGKLDDVIEIQTDVPGERMTLVEVRGEVYVIGR